MPFTSKQFSSSPNLLLRSRVNRRLYYNFQDVNCWNYQTFPYPTAVNNLDSTGSGNGSIGGSFTWSSGLLLYSGSALIVTTTSNEFEQNNRISVEWYGQVNAGGVGQGATVNMINRTDSFRLSVTRDPSGSNLNVSFRVSLENINNPGVKTEYSAQTPYIFPSSLTHRLCGVWDGQTVKLYRSGALLSTTTPPNASELIMSSTSTSMNYGGGPLQATNFYSRIYTRALSPMEVKLVLT